MYAPSLAAVNCCASDPLTVLALPHGVGIGEDSTGVPPRQVKAEEVEDPPLGVLGVLGGLPDCIRHP
jgi:hypothetical protein